MSKIKSLLAREIIDSRGVPTVEVEIELTSRHSIIASVPSGASTGTFEAYELRDGDKQRYFSKGVQNAVSLINSEIKETILGFDVMNQKEIDNTLIDLDGTKNKKRLGANSILAVSLACAKAASIFLNTPLYKYIGGIQNTIPTPMMNIINGGCHSSNSLDFQEFMIIPGHFKSFKESLRAGCEVFHSLKELLISKNLSTSVGDEGGFAPEISSNRECLDLILNAIEKAGYKPGKEIYIALDVAASEFFINNKYKILSEKTSFSSDQFSDYLIKLCKKYSIISLEDPFAENDWKAWQKFNKKYGSEIQIVGDDIFTTNIDLISKGIKVKAANAVLIKVNQIGTLTETMMAIELAQMNGLETVISHRSGETENTFIADLSVATNSGQIKTGSMSRSDRISKFNQLIRIEEIFDSKKSLKINKFY